MPVALVIHGEYRPLAALFSHLVYVFGFQTRPVAEMGFFRFVHNMGDLTKRPDIAIRKAAIGSGYSAARDIKFFVLAVCTEIKPALEKFEFPVAGDTQFVQLAEVPETLWSSLRRRDV